MDDLSLMVLDLSENGLNADADFIEIVVEEDEKFLRFSIRDNGFGMNEETLQKATNPFFSTRKTRSIGLGLSFVKETALSCGGEFSIHSIPFVGTTVNFSFQKDHIDTPPFGDMSQTLITIMTHANIKDFHYHHQTTKEEFDFKLSEVIHMLEGVDYRQSEILSWLHEYVKQQLDKIRGGVK